MNPQGAFTVYLLGAGASRAACPRMPLIGDFFRTPVASGLLRQPAFQNLPGSLSRLGLNAQDIRDGRKDIEAVLSEVMKAEAPLGHRGVTDELLNFICAVLNFSADDYELRGPNLYDDFCRLLSDDDLVLSLNYDVLLDAALQRTEKWEPRSGYGIEFDREPEFADSPPPLQISRASRLQYRKLHGSLNWTQADKFSATARHQALPGMSSNSYLREDDRYPYRVYVDPELLRAPKPHSAIRDRSVHTQDGSSVARHITRPLIVPPSSDKQLNKNPMYRPLMPLWEHAQQGLATAARLVVIGCTVRPADHELRSMLGLALQQNAHEFVALRVVNPSQRDSYETSKSLIELSSGKLRPEEHHGKK